MPIHDLRCTVCGRIARDVYIPLMWLAEPDYSQGYKRTSILGPRPPCFHGGAPPIDFHPPMEILPAHIAVDIYESAATTAWVPDGRGGQVERPVKSLRDIRKIEAETAALGHPHVFRDYNQDRSNRDQNVHGNYTGEKLSEAAKKKFGPGIRRSIEEPVAALGPGVTDDSSTQFGDR